jgi:mRNA-degrading endonuclease RelE of RelBE toxin-antitoxin system
MSYKIIPTETFKAQVKTLQKKYPHIRKDLEDLSRRLKQNPKTGKALGKGCDTDEEKSRHGAAKRWDSVVNNWRNLAQSGFYVNRDPQLLGKELRHI